MSKNIIIVGTTDTKGEQLMMLREKIAALGHRPLLMDLSMGGKTDYTADILPEEIASLAGKSMQDMFDADDRSVITAWMTEGAIAKAQALLADDSLDGIVAVGGMSIALIGATIMGKTALWHSQGHRHHGRHARLCGQAFQCRRYHRHATDHGNRRHQRFDSKCHRPGGRCHLRHGPVSLRSSADVPAQAVDRHYPDRLFPTSAPKTLNTLLEEKGLQCLSVSCPGHQRPGHGQADQSGLFRRRHRDHARRIDRREVQRQPGRRPRAAGRRRPAGNPPGVGTVLSEPDRCRPDPHQPGEIHGLRKDLAYGCHPLHDPLSPKTSFWKAPVCMPRR